MPSLVTRKLTLCQALTFALLLAATDCLSTPQSVSTSLPQARWNSQASDRDTHSEASYNRNVEEVVDFFLGSFCCIVGAISAFPAAAALHERVVGMERLVRLLSKLREWGLGEDAHLHHQAQTPVNSAVWPWVTTFTTILVAVLDGTSCDKEPGGVCVNGRCLKPGCDSILGSKQQEDACMNGRSQFVINGDWKISIPGEYNVAGTKLLYRRSADTWESFEVPGPTREDLHLMVLATDRNPDIEYEYWLPPDQYALHHGRKSPLRQAHHTANYLPWDEPLTTATTTTRAPPITTRPHWFLRPVKLPRQSPQQRPPQPALPRPEQENHRNLLPQPAPGRNCGKCQRVKGRTERKRQYCRKDFVFRAKVVGKVYRGEETRYDVQVIHTYRNSFRLEHREFIWAPNLCDCPHLEVGRQYILMVRRHINYEHTLNRILLEEDSYVVPYRPREDEQLRQHEKLCGNRGHKHAEQSSGSS
ncbi:hypothetical protein fugu_002921 [Takifugu bimaculatus]|uniref:NTR domain-containing protein n=1 Tax=Takifugu bimaculatus TaxID=433685 RepID=A0A4Z2BFF2_9TELE|nr:hypothetical protein fugu_002921 [Takifugu bimaculatus]